MNRRLTRKRSQWQAERAAERRYLNLMLSVPRYWRPHGVCTFCWMGIGHKTPKLFSGDLHRSVPRGGR